MRRTARDKRDMAQRSRERRENGPCHEVAASENPSHRAVHPVAWSCLRFLSHVHRVCLHLLIGIGFRIESLGACSERFLPFATCLAPPFAAAPTPEPLSPSVLVPFSPLSALYLPTLRVALLPPLIARMASFGDLHLQWNLGSLTTLIVDPLPPYTDSSLVPSSLRRRFC